MSEPKFTPGPWLIEKPKTRYQPRILSDRGEEVCRVESRRFAKDLTSVPVDELEYNANSRLIAAAPELFDVLAELHDVAQDAFNFIGGANPPITREQLIENLRETMAKARSVHSKAEGN